MDGKVPIYSEGPLPSPGSNVLHICAEGGFVPILRFILGTTPCYHRRFEEAPEERNKLLTTKNVAGETPLDIAMRHYEKARTMSGERRFIDMRRDAVELLGGDLN